MRSYADALRAVVETLAAEQGCTPQEITDGQVHIRERPSPSLARPLMRRYPRRDPAFAAVSLGTGAVIAASASLLSRVEEVFRNADRDQVFEPSRLSAINALLEGHGLVVYGPYFRLLCCPDTFRDTIAPPGFRIVIEEDPTDERLEQLQPERWPHAISPRRGARLRTNRALATVEHTGEVVGVATMSDDTERLWQIGIDVASSFRGRGLGAALTAALARHALERNTFPWYGVAPANLPSINTALSAGFRLAWVEAFTYPVNR